MKGEIDKKYNISYTSIHNKYEQAMLNLYALESLTDYKIKELGDIIDALQKIDIKKEYLKYIKKE